jgi:hypothetical protein
VINSNARFSETLRLRIAITIAGTKPIFTSGYPNRADEAASTMSQAVANPQPPASARPVTAATTGIGSCRINKNNSNNKRASSEFSATDALAIF